MNIEQEKSVLLRLAQVLGLHVINVSHSNLSSSQYVTLHINERNDNRNRNERSSDVFEVRLSNHKQNPAYYRKIDMEISPHRSALPGIRDRRAITALAEFAGKPELAEKFYQKAQKRIEASRKAVETRRLNESLREANTARRLAEQIPKSSERHSEISLRGMISSIAPKP